MVRLTACLAGLLSINAGAQPTSSVSAFSYRHEMVETQTLYTYTKSNIDGTNPIEVLVYVATEEHLEVFKLERGARNLSFVMADFDWDTFSANHYRSYHRLPNGDFRYQAHATLNTREHYFDVWTPQGSVRAPVSHYPVCIYNFDFMSFNYVFRHLKDPEGSIEIGIADPTWGASSEPFAYKGNVTVSYLGEEAYKGIPCRRYRVGGPGLNNQYGTIWADKEHGYFVNVEHPWRDNPSWKDFKFELQDVKHNVSLADWHELVEAAHAEHIDELKASARERREGR